MPTTERKEPQPIQFDENRESIIIDLGPLLNDILQNLPEYAVSFEVQRFDYYKHEYKLIDFEDDKRYVMDWPKAMKGLKHVREEIRNKKLFFDGLSTGDYNDAGNWDSLATDAVLQAAVLGEVIYG